MAYIPYDFLLVYFYSVSTSKFCFYFLRHQQVIVYCKVKMIKYVHHLKLNYIAVVVLYTACSDIIVKTNIQPSCCADS